MFCFQCQETAKNTGCTIKGMCGKPEETANLQDLLLFVLRGMAVYGEKLKELGQPDRTQRRLCPAGAVSDHHQRQLGQRPLYQYDRRRPGAPRQAEGGLSCCL